MRYRLERLYRVYVGFESGCNKIIPPTDAPAVYKGVTANNSALGRKLKGFFAPPDTKFSIANQLVYIPHVPFTPPVDGRCLSHANRKLWIFK